MNSNDNLNLDSYYEYVREAGKLRTLGHAARWSEGILKTLGTVIDGKTKRKLAKALPDDLATQLRGVFWLLHFRDPNMSSQEFQQSAARRSGNSNTEFALYPTQAVFGGLKRFIGPELNQQIADVLSPEIREMWLKADAVLENA